MADQMTRTPQDQVEIPIEAKNECWRLAQDCARWAAETHEPSVRRAFMAMAKEWSRLALQGTTDV